MERIPKSEHENIKYLETELRELREELKESREVIKRERERIQQLNSEHYIKSGNCDQHAELMRLKRWIEQLQRDFSALLGSRRWRVGNVMVSAAKRGRRRNQKPASLVHAEEIFTKFNTWKQTAPAQIKPAPGRVRKIPVSQLMEQLENDVSALSKSTRYRAGNFITRIPGLLLFRKKPRLAMDHMMELFRDYHAAGDKGRVVSPEQMVELVENLREVFKNFLDSFRWKLGCKLASGLEAVLIRGKKPLATEHILGLFADFEKGRYIIPGLKARRITIEDDSSADDYS